MTPKPSSPQAEWLLEIFRCILVGYCKQVHILFLFFSLSFFKAVIISFAIINRKRYFAVFALSTEIYSLTVSVITFFCLHGSYVGVTGQAGGLNAVFFCFVFSKHRCLKFRFFVCLFFTEEKKT